MVLYDLELSGNCYKVRLFCAINNISLTINAVDYLANEHKSADFIAMNPLGQIPVLNDEGLILRDSQAILIYLSQKHNLHQWWPQNATEQAKVMQWLSFAANEIARGPNDARLHDLFGIELDVEAARVKAHQSIEIVNAQLEKAQWLTGDTPTIADLSCFPYIALASQGGVSIEQYHNVNRWIGDIKALNGYVDMPGI